MSVSRVLRDPSSVSEPLSDRILKAIDQLNYVPNQAAQLLSRSGQIRVGLMYNQPRSAYAVDLLLGAIDEAALANVQLVVRGCTITRDDQSVLQQLIDQKIDAVILTAPLCESDELIQMLDRAGVPGLLIGTSLLPSIGASLQIDEFTAAYELTAHIVSLGHRRIGFIRGADNLSASQKRFDGYRKALDQSAILFEEALVATGRFTYHSGLNAAEHLLDRPDRPTAIFASNDDMAAGTIATAHRLGIHVPDDLTVCGFDDSWIASNVWPEITTVRQPVAEMGGEAINILQELLSSRGSGEPVPKLISLPYEILIRDSTAPPCGQLR